jgi:hypothetical protein
LGQTVGVFFLAFWLWIPVQEVHRDCRHAASFPLERMWIAGSRIGGGFSPLLDGDPNKSSFLNGLVIIWLIFIVKLNIIFYCWNV